jgi:pimeloyl-ACP methyl ester carboxylesterase
VLLVASGRIVTEEPWATEALERFSSALPRAHVEIVDGAGHAVLLDAPDQTIDLVGRWVRVLEHTG